MKKETNIMGGGGVGAALCTDYDIVIYLKNMKESVNVIDFINLIHE